MVDKEEEEQRDEPVDGEPHAKKPKRKSPTSRTKVYLAKLGWRTWSVESRVPIPDKFVTRDCFNFGDLLAMKSLDALSGGVALVQATSGAHHAERCSKIVGIDDARIWIQSGGKILIISWLKSKSSGKWLPRETWIQTIDQLDALIVTKE